MAQGAPRRTAYYGNFPTSPQSKSLERCRLLRTALVDLEPHEYKEFKENEEYEEDGEYEDDEEYEESEENEEYEKDGEYEEDRDEHEDYNNGTKDGMLSQHQHYQRGYMPEHPAANTSTGIIIPINMLSKMEVTLYKIKVTVAMYMLLATTMATSAYIRSVNADLAALSPLTSIQSFNEAQKATEKRRAKLRTLRDRLRSDVQSFQTSLYAIDAHISFLRGAASHRHGLHHDTAGYVTPEFMNGTIQNLGDLRNDISRIQARLSDLELQHLDNAPVQIIPVHTGSGSAGDHIQPYGKHVAAPKCYPRPLY